MKTQREKPHRDSVSLENYFLKRERWAYLVRFLDFTKIT